MGSSKYYTQGVLFIMRDFVSHLVRKYLEYLEENDPENYSSYSKALQEFEKFLYAVTVKDLGK